MKSLVTQISLIILPAHLALGCCWHHDHSCDLGENPGRAAVHLSCTDLHDPADHQSPSHGDIPSHDDDHCSQICNFLVQKDFRSDLEDSQVAGLSLQESSTPMSGYAIASQSKANSTVLDGNTSGPLRTHLLLGVLLI